MIREFIKDMAKYLPSTIAPAIVGLIAIPMITRLFSPGDYGNYILVVATVSILTTVVGWLSMSIIRFYPAYERDGRLKEFYSTVTGWLFVSITILVLILLGILFAIRVYLTNRLYHLMFIGILVFISTAGFKVLQQFLRAKRQVGWYTCFSVWTSVATLGIGIALVISFHYGIEGLLWGAVLGLVVTFPLLWKISGAKISLKAITISGELTKEMAKYGLPLVVANLAAWMLSLSDRYILEFFRSAYETGIYSASYFVSERSILLLASLFLLASAPVEISIWEKEGKKRSSEFISQLTRYYLITCLPAVVGLSVLAKPAIRVFIASEYYEGYRIVPLVTFGAFFLGLQRRFLSGLTFYKKTHLIMLVIIASGLLNLGLNFLLVPRYGYMAAGVTTLVSYVFLLGAVIVISRRYFVWIFPFKSLSKVIAASAVMGVAIYPVGNSSTSSALINLVLGICVGAVVYVLMLFLLREPQKEEIQRLRNFRKRVLGRATK